LLNKKADIKSVTEIILALLILIVLYIVFTSGYIPFLTSSGTKEACKNWVNLQSIKGLKEAHTFESPCVTIEETIKDKDIKTENDLYKILANNMYDCWDMYGRGEVDFYSNFGFKGTYCRVCSEIKTDSSLEQSKRNIDLDKFSIYLSNNHPPGHRETYADFFTKAENAKLDFGSGTLTLDPNKKLYTTFTVYKTTLTNTATQVRLGGCLVVLTPAAISALPTGGLSLVAGLGYCAIGFGVGDFVTRVGGIGVSFYPTITLLQSDSDQIQNACDYIYYKPIQK